MMKRRIFMSLPSDTYLADHQMALKRAIVSQVEQLGFQAEIFFNPRSTEGIAARLPWTPQNLEMVARRCIGGVIVGLPRWRIASPDGEILMATEYAQYEAAILRTLGLPMLVLAQRSLSARGIFEYNFGQFVSVFPDDAGSEWLASPKFTQSMNIWRAELADRRDIFLGYCSSSSSTAERIKKHLQQNLGVTVMDWQTDFSVARTVLEEVALAAEKCSAGIFLFTQDDRMAVEVRRGHFGKSKEHANQFRPVPRDNVVFEAGYFIAAKGKRRVLIVREQGAKIPADLGGDVYALLADRNDISSITETLSRFVVGL